MGVLIKMTMTITMKGDLYKCLHAHIYICSYIHILIHTYIHTYICSYLHRSMTYEKLSQIMKCCDVILTPIVEENWDRQWHAELPATPRWFKQYGSPRWKDGEIGYRNRAWCIVEMMYASHIKLRTSSATRTLLFSPDMAIPIEHGHRPHILYGTNEKTLNLKPVILPKIDDKWFHSHRARDGYLSKGKDRPTVIALEEAIELNLIEESYRGEVNKEGMPHGYGIFQYHSGNIYEGMWRNGKYHGKGKLKHSSGACYEGEYIEGLQDGYGVYRHVTGDVYSGYWKDDLRQGKGLYVYADGDMYDGDWLEGVHHGQGIYKDNKGNCYEGEWNQGLHHGKGRFRFSDGDVYEGDFLNGLQHGKGRMVYPYTYSYIYLYIYIY